PERRRGGRSRRRRRRRRRWQGWRRTATGEGRQADRATGNERQVNPALHRRPPASAFSALSIMELACDPPHVNGTIEPEGPRTRGRYHRGNSTSGHLLLNRIEPKLSAAR